MQLTVLLENGPSDQLLCEHGLSLYAQYRGRGYLIDMGQSGLFAQNADALGVDLAAVDAAFLSHAHYDHTGGLEAFFARNEGAPVWMRREAALNYYGADMRYIGMPQGIVQRHADRFRYAQGVAQAAPGVWLVPHTAQGLAETGRRAGLYAEENSAPVPDDFRHEQCVAFETAEGLVLLTSCAHAGVETCVKEAQEALGRRVRVVAGGFHLLKSRSPETLLLEEKEIRALARRLTAMGVEEIYTGHCTGKAAFEMIRDEIKSRCRRLSPGAVMEWTE